jgi:hypothetical protein
MERQKIHTPTFQRNIVQATVGAEFTQTRLNKCNINEAIYVSGLSVMQVKWDLATSGKQYLDYNV